MAGIVNLSAGALDPFDARSNSDAGMKPSVALVSSAV